MFHQSRQTLKHSLALNLRRVRYGRPKQKVFCVGLQKTGTTSLQYALSKLGYRVAGVYSIKDLERPEQMRERALSLVPKFDAFADNPWCTYYRELDKIVPGAKFILTARDPERWYLSVCKHFGETPVRMHEWIYGVPAPVGNKNQYIDYLLTHQASVRDYFANRPSDFMEFDVASGDGWDKLCVFLGKKCPSEVFPHLNTAAMRG